MDFDPVNAAELLFRNSPNTDAEKISKSVTSLREFSIELKIEKLVKIFRESFEEQLAIKFEEGTLTPEEQE